MEQLKEIYKQKLITNIKNYDNNKYYYFYNHSEVFGIEKTITKNEYELLKLKYPEKKIYAKDLFIESIYEYIYENKKYPFEVSKVHFFAYEKCKDEQDTIREIIKGIYKKSYFIEFLNMEVVFIENNFDIPIEDIFLSLSGDLSKDIYVHIGPYINNDTKGEKLYLYLESLNTSKQRIKNNTKATDLLFEPSINNYPKIVEFIHDTVLMPIICKSDYYDLVVQLIKNDLNVSKTSKAMYLNRNSILLKIDNIQKETGINIQKFSDACAIKMLISIHNI